MGWVTEGVFTRITVAQRAIQWPRSFALTEGWGDICRDPGPSQTMLPACTVREEERKRELVKPFDDARVRFCLEYVLLFWTIYPPSFIRILDKVENLVRGLMWHLDSFWQYCFEHQSLQHRWDVDRLSVMYSQSSSPGPTSWTTRRWKL